MADRPTALRCSHAVLGQHHDAHDWEPQPGMDPVHCPGREQLPVDRLRNLVDRACRHLTPDEGAALRDALAGTMHNATTAIEARHQELAEQAADLERARGIAVQLENENRRIEDEHTEFVLKAGEALGRAQANTEWLRRNVLAECDAIEAEVYGQHDEDDDGMREAVRYDRHPARPDDTTGARP